MGRLRSISLVICCSVFCCANSGSICPLPWNAKNDTVEFPGGYDPNAVCPWGKQIKGFDVTVPTNPTPLEIISVIYGIIPFLVMGLAVLDTIARIVHWKGIGTRAVIFFLFVGIQVGLSELIFKKLVKQARPVQSCNITCGMPSSHATMSIGFFMFMFFDAAYRLMPQLPRSVDAARVYISEGDVPSHMRRCYNARDSIFVLFNLMPITSSHTLSTADFIAFVSLWGIILLPVPFTRVLLHDHSAEQVVIGSIIGFFEAVVLWVIVQNCVLERFLPRLGDRIFGIFVHNYAVPLYEVFGLTYTLIAQAQDFENQSCSAIDKADVHSKLRNMHKVLNWYSMALKHPCCGKEILDPDHPAITLESNELSSLRANIREILGEDDNLSLDSESEAGSSEGDGDSTARSKDVDME